MVGIPNSSRGAADPSIHNVDFANLLGFNPTGPVPTFEEVYARLRRVIFHLHPDRLNRWIAAHNDQPPRAVRDPGALSVVTANGVRAWLTAHNDRQLFRVRMQAVWQGARQGYRQTWDPTQEDPFTSPDSQAGSSSGSGRKHRSPEVVINSPPPAEFVDLTADNGTHRSSRRQRGDTIVISSDDDSDYVDKEDEDDSDEVVITDSRARNSNRVRSGRTARRNGNGGPSNHFAQDSLHNLYALGLNHTEVVVARVRNAGIMNGTGNPQYLVVASVDHHGRVNYRVTTRDIRDARLPTWGSRATSVNEHAIRNQHGGVFLGIFRNNDGSANTANIRDFLFAIEGRAARRLSIGRTLLNTDNPRRAFTIDTLYRDIDNYRRVLDSRAVFKQAPGPSLNPPDKAPSAFDGKGGRGGRRGGGGGGGGFSGFGGGSGTAGNPITV